MHAEHTPNIDVRTTMPTSSGYMGLINTSHCTQEREHVPLLVTRNKSKFKHAIKASALNTEAFCQYLSCCALPDTSVA